MDAGRFDILSRSLEARSRRGALRALGVLGAIGLADRLGLPAAQARKKKGGKKKKDKKRDCPECICPAPTTCPTPDCCRERVCCKCNKEGFEGTECRTFPAPASFTQCDELCGALGYNGQSSETTDPANRAACDHLGNCTIVVC